MIKLRELAEKDLSFTLEGEFSERVTLVQPDGAIIDETIEGKPLTGKIERNRPEMNTDGESVVVYNPVVWLRRSSLARVPESGEVWGVKIPKTPVAGAPMVQYLLDKNFATKGGLGLGRIRLPLVETTGSAA